MENLKEKIQLTEEQWEFINKKKLKSTAYAKKLLALFYKIEFYMKRYGFCDKTNKFFMKLLDVSHATVERYLNALEDLGLIKRITTNGNIRKIFAIRPKIEEKISDETSLNSSCEGHIEGHIEGVYNKGNKNYNLKNNNNKSIVSNESLTETDALKMLTEDLRKKYPTEIVGEALRTYIFNKQNDKIYSPEKYIIGICKKLIRNKKSRQRKIYKQRKREKAEAQRLKMFEEMKKDKATRQQLEGTENQGNTQINDDMYYDWMNVKDPVEEYLLYCG